MAFTRWYNLKIKGPSFHGPWCHLEDIEKKKRIRHMWSHLRGNIVSVIICFVKACVWVCVGLLFPGKGNVCVIKRVD